MSDRSKRILNLALSQHVDDSDSYESEDSDDSLIDKNYNPSTDDSDSQDVDEGEDEVIEDVIDKEVQQAQGVDTISATSWSSVKTSDPLFANFCNKNDSPNIPPDIQSPLQFFKLMVNDNIINDMVFQTNKYAEVLLRNSIKKNARIRQWVSTDSNEMLSFFAVLLSMGVAELPKLNLYWSKDPLYQNKFISSIISRDRFLLLLKCWHFADNSLDDNSKRLYKLQPLSDQLLLNFKEHMIPGESLVIDESMVPWRGRLKFRQYIKNKSSKYGVKLYKLCTTSGYTLNLKVYAGKGDTTPGKSHAESIVDHLLSEYYGKGHTLYCDNYYTSYKLAEKLLTVNTRLCGTVRKNSKYLCSEVVKRKLRRGEIIGAQNESIKFIKWLDKRPVLMLTTCESHDDVLHDTGKLIKELPVKKPNCVLDYNLAKKGVDYSDQMSSYQSPLRKGVKWYRKVAVELLFGTAVINSWILYNSKFPNNRMPILNFRDNLIKALVSSTPSRPRTSKRIHTLAESGPENKKRRKCSGCYKNLRKEFSSRVADNKVKKVYTFCIECEGQPAYCLKCFNESHNT
ncbi:piggybac transposable element-derived protein 4 [Holotrichia oblita]|uniref:Piggybac transposable element-derived protein 4 n=1 Tax=Holotrichia oblita TaxID=644536 RepID=A0ACB9SNN7_HOLOL|nr:piggybac transposable element-derived protein 4 [Holotrichia oblita]